MNVGKANSEIQVQKNEQSREDIKESVRLIDDLKFFLATAPANWQEYQVIRRYYLNSDEGFVSCVYWNNLYFITGTDIVRCIVYRFNHFGRRIVDRKKFEEGIFSDLRNLKCGVDAVLEPPKSEFLEFLYKNSCLRTQKKQKVFFWFNVPHDKLTADALERDLKREKINLPATTVAYKEPALSFRYDEEKFFFNQFTRYIDNFKDENNISSEDNSESALEEEISRPSISEPYKPDFAEDDFTRKSRLKPNYENDFPLDYLDPTEETCIKPSDYVSVDTSGFSPFGYGDDYGSFMEPLSSTYVVPNTSNPLVHNDEYLIEQTQPIRTPMRQRPGVHQHQPLSAKIGGNKFVLNDDLPYQPSLYQPKLTPYHATVPSPYYCEPKSIQHVPTQPQIFSYGDYCYHPEFDYRSPQNGMFDSSYHHNSYTLPEYAYINDDFSPPQTMNPSFIGFPGSQPTSNAHRYPTPSSRQHPVNASVLKKKRNQLHRTQKNDAIRKPTIEKKERIDGKNAEAASRHFDNSNNKLRSHKEEKHNEENENFIPTPESSVTNLDQHSSRGKMYID